VTQPEKAVTFPQCDDDAVAFYRAHGWLLLHTLDRTGTEPLRQWVDEIAAWPQAGGEWLHYREMTDLGAKLCRTENFVPFHDGMRALLCEGVLADVAGTLLGEPAVLYKEKINYKLAGGAGYTAHQDAPAYPSVQVHVSCLLAVDDVTTANGCLEVVSGMHHEVLPMDERGCVRADLAAAMTWDTVEVPAGSTLWFHSRTPHRSGANPSGGDRRAIYPTYNARSEGDLRGEYYRRKLAEFASSDGPSDRVRVSLINDFEGRPV
jgi:hypothetical protein